MTQTDDYPDEKQRFGFTLAELLIALAILGVIATFTIPKVLQTQQNTQFKAVTKEAIGMVSEAYMSYKRTNTPTAATKPLDLTPYMNYVKFDTITTIDDVQTLTTNTCSDPTEPCLRLHSGATLVVTDFGSFGGTAPTNAIWFGVDPDGKVTDGTTNGPGKALWFTLYYTGRITTIDQQLPTTTGSFGVWGPTSGYDPPWFSWN